jgi:hypothetical protein
MSTAQAIIQSALEMIGAYSPGEIMSAADSARALDQLNKMLDSWSNESLMAFVITEQSFALVAGKTSYSIGTTASPDVNATRPLRILEGPGAAYILDSNNNRYPVNVIPRDQWNLLPKPGPTNVSDFPDTLFYDPQYPLGVINVSPSPTISYTLYFDSYGQLATLANLNANISFPPGYEAAIQSNLAVWCAPFFKNAGVSEDVKRLARDTKKIVKRTNRRTNLSQLDAMNAPRGTYNIYTDSPR